MVLSFGVMIAPLAKNLNNLYVQKALDRLTQGSRVLILQEKASTILLGDWVTIPGYKGVLFSNQNFMYRYDSFIDYNYILLESKTMVNKTKLLKWCRQHSLELGNVEPNFNQTTGIEIWGYIDRNIDTICGHRVLDVY